ncbi:nucleoside transporter 2, putative [Plasmodium chabaudi chabaudi]|uniref:Nucleoside transporter 2, putative n=1 Tax=Plasmodium chabaudi chabaudi TaxID=31271 RepID=A0A4V0K5V3_PLACU|nr:nucleoside transporter 2, putative [Plasmodium chabaudi chabaudi]VTZ68024.1 nucleoside transporter 2, putative [Plasmodium chabaudi chabaudi]|eukprot:XP_744237.2 nucleoside transporter 2, putative [Plasmodium chabaudi chabaudi]
MNDVSKSEHGEISTDKSPIEKEANIKEISNEVEDDNIKKNEIEESNLFANVTLCLMGISSVLLYNCVLNTTPHIHELLNKDIIVSFTFFIYFLVLVLVSLFISLFVEVKTRIYDACFILSFILQLLYPFVVKYCYKNMLLFYLLIVVIGATCSLMKTMIFSFATIAVNSSKVVCLSYGVTGIYSFTVTTIFFYFVIRIDKDINKLFTSVFITSSINCTLILVSFICYTMLKRTESFKKKIQIYQEQKKIKISQQMIAQSHTNDNNTPSPNDPKNSFSINVNAETNGNATSTQMDTLNSKENNNNDTTDIQEDNQNKSRLRRLIYLINIKKKEYMEQGSTQIFLFKKAFIFLFCTFYNIFLKILVFPVVCPEMWTKQVDERYILIGMVQIADCVSRIFPTCAEYYPKLRIFLLPQKKVLIFSLARTILSILCLIVPLNKIGFFDNFIFKCVLIFSNIYLNGWFVVLSFINISDVLKPFNSLRNVATVSALGSSFLRIGLLTGYLFSTKYKRYVNGS